MKILRKIVVMSSVTGGKEVERYICNRCGRNIKDIIKVDTRRKNNRGNKRYSKLIYIDKCDECKRIIKQGRNGDI
ncbi:MAG: hypothetical protein E6423_09805 [Clostridium sp.]|uniref:hypothetical protein n=1 Tax=Bacillota TaxID=1239 RepID=UPI0028FF2F6B|nr:MULTISPECIES: hypothetical protein [Bacillota]MDU2102815.1 hypothetical protein [Veillonella sp.]MDU2108929.1 hypothetical protein [Clostridium sp.]MDU3355962.1 hypothetical protein [Clostridium sp.]MDU6809072.1 hypothetical protein [Clostridium sp.]MDU6876508.1 hypothetical protein [Clostridium sp.]